MARVTIPANTEYDEGKKGPWVKLTWEQAFDLVHMADFGCQECGFPGKAAGAIDELREQLAAGRNEENYERRLSE